MTATSNTLEQEAAEEFQRNIVDYLDHVQTMGFQSQRDLTEQLCIARAIVQKMGLYDAADYLRDVIERN